MNFIIVWEEVPEQTKIYHIKNVDEEMGYKIKKCNQKFSNLADNTEEDEELLQEIQKFLESYIPVISTGSKVGPYNFDGYTTIIITGFMM